MREAVWGRYLLLEGAAVDVHEALCVVDHGLWMELRQDPQQVQNVTLHYTHAPHTPQFQSRAKALLIFLAFMW